MDTRLEHLLKLEAEAQADVRRYVARKWPVGSRVAYTFRALRVAGEVTGHDVAGRTVTVVGDDKSKRRVPYARIVDRKRT